MELSRDNPLAVEFWKKFDTDNDEIKTNISKLEKERISNLNTIGYYDKTIDIYELHQLLESRHVAVNKPTPFFKLYFNNQQFRAISSNFALVGDMLLAENEIKDLKQQVHDLKNSITLLNTKYETLSTILQI